MALAVRGGALAWPKGTPQGFGWHHLQLAVQSASTR